MKKGILLTTATFGLSLSSSIFAAEAPTPTTTAPAHNSGLYIGAAFGYTSTQVNSHAVTSSTDVKGNSNMYGPNGMLLLGYRYNLSFDQANIAAQVNGSYYHVNSNWTQVGSANEKNAQHYSYGIDVLPGFYLSDDVDLYLLGGYQLTDFTFKSNTSPSSNSYNKNKTLGGWDLGLGTQIKLANQFALDLVYKYTFYNSDKIRSGGLTESKSPDSNQFNIGVSYYFW